jgi:hypothetical protein
MTRFDLRYDSPFTPLAAVLGMGPRASGVDVGTHAVDVRMGWAFRARIPLEAVRAAEPGTHPLLAGWGVHGWAGRWFVNGSARGIVRLDIDPPVRARAAGLPIRLTTLQVSVEDPDGFLAALPTSARPKADPS